MYNDSVILSARFREIDGGTLEVEAELTAVQQRAAFELQRAPIEIMILPEQSKIYAECGSIDLSGARSFTLSRGNIYAWRE